MQSPNSASTVVYPKTSGPTIYRVKVTDNYGCNFKVFDEVTITMNVPVPAFAGNDTIAAMGVPQQLFGSGGIKYVWSPAHILDNPFSPNPFALLQTDTRFYLTVRDSLGCIGTSSVFIKLYKGPAFYIPNAFTPNVDGLNAVFRAIAPGIKHPIYFTISDRWGNLLFHTPHTLNGWDRKYGGHPKPPTVTFCIIK